MSLPVKSKTWLFIANSVASINKTYGGTGVNTNDCNDFLLQLKNILKGFSGSGWTVDYSCDGTTAGTVADAVDRWAAVGNLVHAASGVAHSWIVLKQSGIFSTFKLLIDLNSATANQASISYSQSAGFTGGTTTNAPTATDQCPLNSAAAGTPGAYGPGSSAHAGTFHCIQATDGSQLRMVVCSGGNAMGAWIIGAPAAPPAGWSLPFIGWVFSSGAVGTEGVVFANLTRGQNARGRVSATNFAAYLSCEGVNASEMGATIAGANDIDASYPMSGMGVVSTATAGTRGRLGTLVDVWCGLVALATATSYGTQAFAQFGDLILPWDGATSPSAA